MLVDASAYYPKAAIVGGWATRADYYEKNRDVLPRIIRGWVEANDYIIANPDAALEALQKNHYQQVPLADLKEQYKAQKMFTSAEWRKMYADGTVTKWLQQVTDFFVRFGGIQNPVPASQYFETKPYPRHREGVAGAAAARRLVPARGARQGLQCGFSSPAVRASSASYLVPALVARGYDVTVFDLAAEPSTLAPCRDRIGYIRGDLGAPADLYRAMMHCRPEGVFHLGAILAGPCEENPVRGFAVNFGSTQALLDASVAQKVRKFFMVSSIAVFGRDAPQPVPDDAVKNPETIYGQTKLASEHLLAWYAAKRGLDTSALRFTWVFGPGRTTGITAMYSSLILDAIARGEPITIPNPDERGDWLYVKDAVKAILALWDARDLRQRDLQHRRRRALDPRSGRDRAQAPARRARRARRGR